MHGQTQSRYENYVRVKTVIQETILDTHMGHQTIDASDWEAGSSQCMWAARASKWFEALSKRDSSNFFGLGKEWQTFVWAHAQNADKCRRNPFACGKLSSLAPYFRLFQWFLRVSDRYEPWEAGRLVRSLIPALLADIYKITFLDIEE